MNLKDLKKRAYFLIALFLIILFAYLIFPSKSSPEEIVEEKEIVLVKDDIAEKKEFKALLNPIAVSIDNYPNNQHLKGLEQATIVYELPTEGASSRFLAIYDNNNDNEFVIGPVRSLRPYFLDFSADFQALVVHCGGSPEALSRIASQRLTTLNEFYYGQYFKRDHSLKAPNNIYIKNSDYLQYLIDKDKERIEEEWLFKEAPNFDFEQFQEVTKINSYYSEAYQANWLYDEQLEVFVRDPYKYRAKTLIFHFVEALVVDDKLRLKFIDKKEGPATICYLGKCYEAIWQKEDKYRYYIENQPLYFEKNQTWISVMPQFTKLSF